MKTNVFSTLKSLFFSHGGRFLAVVLVFLLMLADTLSPEGIYLWAVCPGVLLFLFPWFRYVDKSAVCLALFGGLFALFAFALHTNYSGSSLIANVLAPLPLYCLGRWLVDRLAGRERELILLVFLSVLCITFILLVRTIIDVGDNGVVSVSREFEIEGVKTMSATLYGMYAAISLVGLPMFFVSSGRRTLLSWLFLALAVLGLLSTVHLVNRTGLVIAVVVTFVGLVYRSRTNIGKYILILGAIVLVVYVLIETGVISEEIVAAYEFRQEETEREGSSAAGGRGHRWLDAILRVWYMPLGWYHEEAAVGYNFVHNWWLDVGRQVGLLPLLLLLVPTVLSIKNCITLFKHGGSRLHLLLLSLNVVLFLACFVEPVMEGSAMVAYYYMFVWGMTAQAANRSRTIYNNV